MDPDLVPSSGVLSGDRDLNPGRGLPGGASVTCDFSRARYCGTSPDVSGGLVSSRSTHGCYLPLSELGFGSSTAESEFTEQAAMASKAKANQVYPGSVWGGRVAVGATPGGSSLEGVGAIIGQCIVLR